MKHIILTAIIMLSVLTASAQIEKFVKENGIGRNTMPPSAETISMKHFIPVTLASRFYERQFKGTGIEDDFARKIDSVLENSASRPIILETWSAPVPAKVPLSISGAI